MSLQTNIILTAALLASAVLPGEALAAESSVDGSATISADEGTGDDEPAIRKFRPERGMAELGIFGGAFFFSKTHDFYDPATAPQEPLRTVAPDLGVRAAYFPLSFLGVEAEFSAIPAKYEPGGNAFIYGARAHAILQLPLYRVVPFITGGYGLMGVASDASVAGNDVDPIGHYGGGVKFFLNRYLALRLDVRHFIAAQAKEQTDGTSHAQALLGLSVTLGRKRPKKAPASDRDGDGFLDSDDACPNDVGIAPNGCPERDSDGDSVLDSVDACPAVAGVAPTGCPPEDRDRDGILDGEDECPDEPGVAPDGCPLRDSDGDGILDPDDQCPDKPERRNGFEDTDGCPDEIPQEVKTHTGVIRGIFFDFNSDKIGDRSRPVLDAAIKVLREYEGIRIEIVGHTDDVGKREYNLELSKARAAAVRDYMVKKGLSGDRISTRGAGPDEPLADNTHSRGRAENRRIEFKVITD